jgi:2-oxoglutarate dehydrogenase complex dehydrogenase (E1) component-like enzyme
MLKSGSGIPAKKSSVAVELDASESVRIAAMLNAFETVGHLVADLDPLNMQKVYKDVDSLTRKFRFA